MTYMLKIIYTEDEFFFSWVEKLKKGGYSAQELKDGGFPVNELKAGGFHCRVIYRTDTGVNWIKTMRELGKFTCTGLFESMRQNRQKN